MFHTIINGPTPIFVALRLFSLPYGYFPHKAGSSIFKVASRYKGKIPPGNYKKLGGGKTHGGSMNPRIESILFALKVAKELHLSQNKHKGSKH